MCSRYVSPNIAAVERESNSLATVHERIPVVLPDELHSAWLDPQHRGQRKSGRDSAIGHHLSARVRVRSHQSAEGKYRTRR